MTLSDEQLARVIYDALTESASRLFVGEFQVRSADDDDGDIAVTIDGRFDLLAVAQYVKRRIAEAAPPSVSPQT